MDSLRFAVIALSLAVLVTGPANADVLLMDSIQSAPQINTPQTGMSMDSVRSSFGSPATEHPAVSTDRGPQQPPITRWDYDGYSVFFEYDKVVHSVIQHPMPE